MKFSPAIKTWMPCALRSLAVCVNFRRKLSNFSNDIALAGWLLLSYDSDRLCHRSKGALGSGKTPPRLDSTRLRPSGQTDQTVLHCQIVMYVLVCTCGCDEINFAFEEPFSKSRCRELQGRKILQPSQQF